MVGKECNLEPTVQEIHDVLAHSIRQKMWTVNQQGYGAKHWMLTNTSWRCMVSFFPFLLTISFRYHWFS